LKTPVLSSRDANPFGFNSINVHIGRVAVIIVKGSRTKTSIVTRCENIGPGRWLSSLAGWTYQMMEAAWRPGDAKLLVMA